MKDSIDYKILVFILSASLIGTLNCSASNPQYHHSADEPYDKSLRSVLEEYFSPDSNTNDVALFDTLDDIYNEIGKERFFGTMYRVLESLSLEENVDIRLVGVTALARYVAENEQETFLAEYNSFVNKVELAKAKKRISKKADLLSQDGFGEYLANAIQENSERAMEKMYHPQCLEAARARNQRYYNAQLKRYLNYSDKLLLSINWIAYSDKYLLRKRNYPVVPTHDICLRFVSPDMKSDDNFNFCSPAVFDNDRWYLVFSVPAE